MTSILSLLLGVTICTAPTAVDGDTLRCGTERVRLLGIDAPEMPGHCRRGRRCAPGDPVAARDSLRAALALGKVRVARITRDRYGRAVAVVSARGINLSCWQIQHRHAVYRGDWDNGRRIARGCALARR